MAAREGRLQVLAAAADGALTALEEDLRAALDSARRGSARVVSGDQPPGLELEAAAAAVAGAAPPAAAVVGSLATLSGTIRALDRGGAPAAPATPAELESIAVQLLATAPAADGFAAMRRRTGEVLQALDGALAALERRDVEDARQAVTAARDLLEILAAWNPGLVTLPIWLETAGAMADALERLVVAVQAGDADGITQAQLDFEAASAEAREADVALQIALSEGGGAVAAAPLQRLVGVLRRTSDARASLATILHASSSPAP